MYQSILEGRVPDANTQPTFLFADIAGFTALTEAHGDAEAAELVEEFSGRVQELLAGPRRRADRGDWFGTTINLAARVAAAASGCEVLLTEATKQAAGGLRGVAFRDRGEERFKNLTAAVRVYAAYPESRPPSGEWPIDPVCRMAVDPARSAGTLIHRGVEYHFCSLECAGRFAGEPANFAIG
jgi:adenylate cyclase